MTTTDDILHDLNRGAANTARTLSNSVLASAVLDAAMRCRRTTNALQPERNQLAHHLAITAGMAGVLLQALPGHGEALVQLAVDDMVGQSPVPVPALDPKALASALDDVATTARQLQSDIPCTDAHDVAVLLRQVELLETAASDLLDEHGTLLPTLRQEA